MNNVAKAVVEALLEGVDYDESVHSRAMEVFDRYRAAIERGDFEVPGFGNENLAQAVEARYRALNAELKAADTPVVAVYGFLYGDFDNPNSYCSSTDTVQINLRDFGPYGVDSAARIAHEREQRMDPALRPKKLAGSALNTAPAQVPYQPHVFDRLYDTLAHELVHRAQHSAQKARGTLPAEATRVTPYPQGLRNYKRHGLVQRDKERRSNLRLGQGYRDPVRTELDFGGASGSTALSTRSAGAPSTGEWDNEGTYWGSDEEVAAHAMGTALYAARHGIGERDFYDHLKRGVPVGHFQTMAPYFDPDTPERVRKKFFRLAVQAYPEALRRVKASQARGILGGLQV